MLFVLIYRFGQWYASALTNFGKWIYLLSIFSLVFGVDAHHSNTYQLFAFLLCFLITALILSVFHKNNIKVCRHLPDFFIANQVNQYALSVKQLSLEKPLVNISIFDVITNHYPSGFYWSYRRWLSALARNRNGGIYKKTIDALDPSGLVTMECLPFNRGMIQFDAIKIGIADPFNVFNFVTLIKNQENCLVLPKLYSLKIQFLNERLFACQTALPATRRRPIDCEDLAYLREYRHGDPLNKIHWRSAARQGRMMVRQAESRQELAARHVLLIDAFVGNGIDLQFEESLALAHSIIKAYPAQKIAELNLLMYQDDLIFSPAKSSYALLATAKPTLYDRTQDLASAIPKKIVGYSHAICILMTWNTVTQALVAKLKKQGISTSVILIHHNNPVQDDSIIEVNCLSIEEDLKQYD